MFLLAPEPHIRYPLGKAQSRAVMKMLFSSLERRHFEESHTSENHPAPRGPAEAYARIQHDVINLEARRLALRSTPPPQSGIPDLNASALLSRSLELEEVEIKLGELNNKFVRTVEFCGVDYALKSGSHRVVFIPSAEGEPLSFRALLVERKGGPFEGSAKAAMQNGRLESTLQRMERLVDDEIISAQRKVGREPESPPIQVDVERRFIRGRIDSELALMRAASERQFPGIVREIKSRHRQGEREAAKQWASIPGISSPESLEKT
jgi:hypothetical protein